MSFFALMLVAFMLQFSIIGTRGGKQASNVYHSTQAGLPAAVQLMRACGTIACAFQVASD